MSILSYKPVREFANVLAATQQAQRLLLIENLMHEIAARRARLGESTSPADPTEGQVCSRFPVASIHRRFTYHQSVSSTCICIL